MLQNAIKNHQKSPNKFWCEKCDYKCNKKSEFTRHKNTLKHSNAIQKDSNATHKIAEIAENIDLVKEKKFICDECCREFKHSSSYYRHRKKCKQNKEIINIENTKSKNKDEIIETLIKENSDFKNIILEVVKNNKELQQQNFELQKQNQNFQVQVLDMCKTIQPSNNHSYNNNNNKTFNLQFFLNEQCKDAMNITDFAESISVQLKDLEKIGSSGYINGISSIIIKELKELDVTKRPVHCSDAKRETLYIKDEDKWEKECPENTKMKKVIRNVEKKNINLINEWTDKNPAYYDSTTSENDEYLRIMQQTMGGKGDYEENKNKIIKKIAKEVVIDK